MEATDEGARSIERCRAMLRRETRLAERLAEDLRLRLAEPVFAASATHELAFALHGVTSRVLRYAAVLEGLTAEKT